MKNKILIVLFVSVIILICIFSLNRSYKIFDRSAGSGDLTAEEISTISKSIVAVQCNTFQSQDTWGDEVFGSGTYLMIREPICDTNRAVILTNSHVAENPEISYSGNTEGLCKASFNQKTSYWFKYFYDTTVLDTNKDFSILIPSESDPLLDDVVYLNYNGEPMTFCTNITVGTKVYIFGYPGNSDAYVLPSEPESKKMNGGFFSGMDYQKVVDEYNKSRNLIVTEGIISGKSEDGYFTNAKIDSGNSGGVAVSKQKGELCLVGIPTWVSVGEYDNLGIIQPIENIYKAGINWERLSPHFKGIGRNVK